MDTVVAPQLHTFFRTYKLTIISYGAAGECPIPARDLGLAGTVFLRQQADHGCGSPVVSNLGVGPSDGWGVRGAALGQLVRRSLPISDNPPILPVSLS